MFFTRELRLADPSLPRSPNEVPSEDYSRVVVLEPLGCVDAANLVDAIGVAGPVVRLRDTFCQPPGVGFGVPWLRPIANLHIRHERSVRQRIGPTPTEARRESRRPTSVSPGAGQRLEFLRGVDYIEIEFLRWVQDHERRLAEAERVLQPPDERLRASTPELRLQLVLDHWDPGSSRG